MKRILFPLLFLLSMSVFGQSFDVKYGTFRQYFLMVPMASPPSAPVKGMAYMDTDGQMYVYNGSTWVSGASQWSLSGSDITNTNAGTVIIDSLLKIWPMPPGVLAAHDNPYKFMVMGNDGRVWWANSLEASQMMDDTTADRAAAGSPPVTATLIRDTTLNYLKAATSGDQISDNLLGSQNYHLEYWKSDFSSAQMENGDNANIMVLGDSYAAMYGGWLKMQGGGEFGYGGGFEIFEGKAWTTYDKSIYCSIGAGWSTSYDATDTKNFFERYAESSTVGATIGVSAQAFNKFMVNYRQSVGGGTFSVQVGSSGSATNVNSNGAALSAWYSVDYGKTTYMHPSDTVFIKVVSGTVRLYGYNIQYNPYVESYSAALKKGALSVHIVQNAGSPIYEMYRGKDTASIHRLVDSLQCSLAILTFLDDAVYTPVQCMDTLITYLQTMRPEMDILLIAPNDDKNHDGEPVQVPYDSLARVKEVGYYNAYNRIGDIYKIAASGASTDSIHLSYNFYGLVWKDLHDILFYPVKQTSVVDAFQLQNRGDYMLFTGTKNMCIVSRSTGRMVNTANNTMFGYRDVLFKRNTGTNNTYIGALSGNANTTGSNNTGIGNNALTANIDASGNTAVGDGALASNTTAAGNTAVGANAMFYNTTNGSSTAVGYHALGDAANTGISNCAFGYQALRLNQSGTQNVAVGVNSGAVNVSGKQNVFVGNSSGANATYDYNTYVGYLSGNLASSGYGNTAVGYGSLKGASAMSGSQNTSIGYSSLIATTGAAENNTAVGANAGLALTTGDGNVLIGQSAGAQLTTQSNQLYIDNSNTTTPLILGDFSANTLVVNGTRYDVIGTISDNDSTPSFAGGNLWKYNGTANSVSIDAIDDEVVGALYEIHGNSDTYTITVIDGTPAGGDSFNLAGAAWVGGNQDVLLIRCIATGAFVEVSRSDN
jgi:hypothetical protein